MTRLVLFDIDETMISSDGAGRRAIGKALARLFGGDISTSKVSMSGKTDPQILTEILKHCRMEDQEIQSRIKEILDIYITLLQDEIDKSGSYIIHRGIPELLDLLHNHEKVFLGLLTGNIEKGARMKLEPFNLNRYFPIGAYGSDSASRMDLPEIATGRGKQHFKVDFRPEEVTIIGDSIYDVRCAKGYGAKSLAVNTGSTEKEHLLNEKPDFFFEDLSDLEDVLKAILA